MPLAAASLNLTIGTYTDGAGQGLYAVSLDTTTGSLSAPRLAAEVASPSFLAVSPDRRTLYAVSESAHRLHAYARQPDGTSRALNDQPTEGANPCDVAVDATGRLAVVANYTGGSVIAYALRADGGIGERAAFFQHTHASGADGKRQAKAHAHGVTFSPDNRFVLVPDLGGDRVYLYKLHEAEGGTLTLSPHAAQAWLDLAPGTGPRKVVFSRDGAQAYVVGELDAMVTVCAWDARAGRLLPTQRITMLPPDWTGPLSGAEIATHPSGRTVYASNRGHDSIAIFARAEDGALTAAGHLAVGRKPRHFTLTADGRWLLVAAQEGRDLRAYALDAEGRPVGSEPISVLTDFPAKPVCVLVN